MPDSNIPLLSSKYLLVQFCYEVLRIQLSQNGKPIRTEKLLNRIALRSSVLIARFAKAHLEYYCCYGVRLDELDRVFLIIMWLEFHQGFLQSALYHSGHTPESLSAEAAHAGAAAVAVACLPVPLPPQNRCGLVGEAPSG